MLVERFDRRRHRAAMAAVLGSTAAIAVCGSLLIAPAAQASTLGGVTASLPQTTVPLGSSASVTTTTASSPAAGPVGSLASGLTTPITSTVSGTSGVNLAPVVTAVTTPVATTVDQLLAPVTSGSTTATTTTTPAPAPVTSAVSGATTPVTTLVGGTTGVALAPTVTAVTTPVTTALDGLLAGGSTTGTTTSTTTVAPPATTLGSVLTTTTSAVTGTVGALTGTGISPTSLIDLSGSGTGRVNAGSTSGIVGLSAGPGGLSVGVLGGTVTTTVGSVAAAPTGSATTTPAPTPSAAPDPSATTPTAAGTSSAPATSAGGAPSSAGVDTSVTLSSASGGALAALQLSRSAPSVYPVKDGYRDSVRFDVRGLTAGRQSVGVTGTAVLTKAGRAVQSWALAGSTAALTWNGRVGGAVRTGLYTLSVTARSADGATRTASTTVQVLSQHLATRTVTATSKVAGTASTAVMPAAVRKALALGAVSVRLRTVATVHGAAALVFAGSGVHRTVPLRSGTRTTAALAVPKAFTTVTIRHTWKRGTRLVSLKAIWTYRTLVR